MSRPHSPTSKLLPIAMLAALGCGSEKAEPDGVGPSSGGPVTVTVAQGTGGENGVGGGGGAPGSGGGGAAPGTGGAASGGGGSSSVSTTGSGIPDECGEPGDCGGDQPTACNSNACTAPEIDFICPGTDDEPPAARACSLAERLYRTGVWARFIDCLREGDADTQCNDGEALVQACIASTLADACPNEAADVFCEAVASGCANEAQPFEVDDCKADLVPFGQNGFELYAECIDVPEDEGACNRTHQECFDEIAP